MGQGRLIALWDNLFGQLGRNGTLLHGIDYAVDRLTSNGLEGGGVRVYKKRGRTDRLAVEKRFQAVILSHRERRNIRGGKKARIMRL